VLNIKTCTLYESNKCGLSIGVFISRLWPMRADGLDCRAEVELNIVKQFYYTPIASTMLIRIQSCSWQNSSLIAMFEIFAPGFKVNLCRSGKLALASTLRYIMDSKDSLTNQSTQAQQYQPSFAYSSYQHLQDPYNPGYYAPPQAPPTQTPSNVELDELDQFMYQTGGAFHNRSIPSVATSQAYQSQPAATHPIPQNYSITSASDPATMIGFVASTIEALL
jgi:hypothetical protein